LAKELAELTTVLATFEATGHGAESDDVGRMIA
jgi:hypothetical protein